MRDIVHPTYIYIHTKVTKETYRHTKETIRNTEETKRHTKETDTHTEETISQMYIQKHTKETIRNTKETKRHTKETDTHTEETIFQMRDHISYARHTTSDKTYYSVAKTHKIPYLYRSFPAKEPYNEWLFCGK